MKLIRLAALLSLSLVTALPALAEEPTKICGRYEVLLTAGMLQILLPILRVPDPSGGPEKIFRLSNAGESAQEVAERQALITSMQEGETYCVTGEVLQLSDAQAQLTPMSVELAP